MSLRLLQHWTSELYLLEAVTTLILLVIALAFALLKTEAGKERWLRWSIAAFLVRQLLLLISILWNRLSAVKHHGELDGSVILHYAMSGLTSVATIVAFAFLMLYVKSLKRNYS